MNIKVKLLYDDIAIPMYVEWTFTDPLHSGKNLSKLLYVPTSASWCVSSIFHLLFLYLYLLVSDGHSHISSGHSRISRIRGNSWPFVRCRTLWGLLYPSSAHSSSVSTTLMAFIAIGHLHRLLSHRHFS